MAVDRSRLKPPAPRPATPAPSGRCGITRRTSFMLSGAQLGITVTGLLVGYVAEPLIGAVARRRCSAASACPRASGVAIGAVLALLFSTVVQMLFGELFPKNLAIARPEPVALRLARSTALYLQRVRLADLGLRPGVEPAAPGAADRAGARRRARRHRPRPRAHRRRSPATAVTCRAELSMLLDRIARLPEPRRVEHAMIPRPRVDDGRRRPTTARATCAVLMATGHSGYPVLGADTDDVVGVVHLADLLAVDGSRTPRRCTTSRAARPGRPDRHCRCPTCCAQLRGRGQPARLRRRRVRRLRRGDHARGPRRGARRRDHRRARRGRRPAYVPSRATACGRCPATSHVDEVERPLGHRPARAATTRPIAGLVIAAATAACPSRATRSDRRAAPGPGRPGHDDEPEPQVLRRRGARGRAARARAACAWTLDPHDAPGAEPRERGAPMSDALGRRRRRRSASSR